MLTFYKHAKMCDILFHCVHLYAHPAISQNGCMLICVMVGAGCFHCSSALCSAQPQGPLSHLMKKRVDLLQITDAENRLTRLACTFPISCTTKASTQVMGTREESTRGFEDGEGS